VGCRWARKAHQALTRVGHNTGEGSVIGVVRELPAISGGQNDLGAVSSALQTEAEMYQRARRRFCRQKPTRTSKTAGDMRNCAPFSTMYPLIPYAVSQSFCRRALRARLGHTGISVVSFNVSSPLYDAPHTHDHALTRRRQPSLPLFKGVLCASASRKLRSTRPKTLDTRLSTAAR
jgi:hypothetical protein